jgi:hypothetical protein
MFSHVRPAVVLLLLVGLGAVPLTAQAQRAPGAVGLGVQAGEPSGVSLKFYTPEGQPAYDVLAAWSFDNFVFLNGRVLFAQPLRVDEVEDTVEQPVQWFIGPGAYVGVYDDGGSEAGLGVSGTVGIDILLAEHFELYLQVTPRFELVRETEPDIGGGLGLRYYL